MKLYAYETQESLGSVLGIEKEPERERFNGICEVLKEAGVEVQRFDEVKDKDQFEAGMILPCFKIEDQIVLSGEYPSTVEVAKWFDLDHEVFKELEGSSTLMAAANSDRIGYCCGVGTDVYLDPNEDEEN